MITPATGDTVTVQTTGASNVFNVNSVNNVQIKGFTIQGDSTGARGVYLVNANFCNITNNIIRNLGFGVSALPGFNNNITNNTIYNTTYGVTLGYQSNNNIVSNNSISNPIYDPNSETRLGISDSGGAYFFAEFNLNNQHLNNVISNVNEGIFMNMGSNFTVSGNNITIKDTYNSPRALILSIGGTANQIDVVNNNILNSEGKINDGSRGII